MTALATSRARGFAALALTLSAACWGSATVMTKAVLAELPPFLTLALQLGASVAALWAATLLVGLRPRLGPLERRAALSGLLEPGLAYGVGVPGLVLTSAANAAVIGAAEPAVIVLLGWLLWRRPVGPALAAAVAATMAGVALITLTGADVDGASLLGDAMILAGVMLAALYVLASSRFVAAVHPLPLAALQQSVGLVAALALLALARAAGMEAAPTAIPPAVAAAAMASGVVQYALAFWLDLVGLRVYPAGEAGLFLALTPVFGVAAAAAFLGETVAPAQATGAALVIGALVWMARRGP